MVIRRNFFILALTLLIAGPIAGAAPVAKIVAADNNPQSPVIKEGGILSLEECVNIALSHNPNIGIAQSTTQIYKSRIGQSKSGYLPQLNISSGYNRQNMATASKIDKTNNQYSGSIGLDQLVYDFGRILTKTKIQKINFTSSKYDVDDTVVQVAYNVKQSYFTALSSKINKDIQNQTILQNEQHLKQAKAFFVTGVKSKIDVTTAEVNLSNSKLNFIKADSSYKTALASLSNAMGVSGLSGFEISDTVLFKRPNSAVNNELNVANKTKKTASPEKKTPVAKDAVLKSSVEKYNLTDNLTFKKYNMKFEDAVKTAYENRPDLKAFISRESAAGESVKLAKKDYLPVVSGFANYNFGGQSFPLDNGWSFGANVSLPVFNGYLTKNQIAEARANVDVARSNIEMLKQNIYFQIQQAYIALTETEKRIPVAKLAVNQARENLELANGRYNVGVGNSVEVQDAQTNYNNAQLGYVQVFYDYNIARSNLERAMGIK